jgi:hypothetical protein
VKLSVSSPYERLLIDDALLAYIEWREQCAAVWECHRHGQRTSGEEAARAYGAYRAALDREEAAAAVYAKQLARLTDLLPRRSRTRVSPRCQI